MLIWQTENAKSVSASTVDELALFRMITFRHKIYFLLHAQTISLLFQAAMNATGDLQRMMNIFGYGSSRAKIQKAIQPETRFSRRCNARFEGKQRQVSPKHSGANLRRPNDACVSHDSDGLDRQRYLGTNGDGALCRNHRSTARRLDGRAG
jgi:hypothetical protein